MKKLKYVITFCLAFNNCEAQIDLQCNGRDLHSLYLLSLSPITIYRIDSVDTNPTNQIFLLSNLFTNAYGISINNNLDTLTGTETMYFAGGPNNFYYFWNGSGWTNTNHSAGSLAAVNIGGSHDYIFNLAGGTGEIYRYDGSGNATLLLSNLNTSYASIYDIAIDNMGNFYLFYTNNQQIVGYNPSGIPVTSYTTTGFPVGIQPGFAILGSRLYAIATSLGGGDLYEGIITGSNINFTLIKNIGIAISDIAACPQAGDPLSGMEDPLLSEINVYPNPFHNELNIYTGQNKITEVLIYDITSRLFLQNFFTNSTSINVEQLAKGIYLYEVRNKNGVIQKGKLVKD